MLRRHCWKPVAIGATLLTALAFAPPATGAGGTAAAVAISGEDVIVTDTATGDPVELTLDSDAIGERLYSGTLSNSDSVQVRVYDIPMDSNVGSDATPIGESQQEDYVLEEMQAIDSGAPVLNWQISLAVAETQTSVAMAWMPEADATYEVSRDGTVIATGSETSFVDSNLPKGANPEYRLVSTTGATQSTRTVPTENVIQAYQPYKTAVQYETFIPNYRVPAGWLAGMTCSARRTDEFGGDNRSFSLPTTSASTPDTRSDFRTLMYFEVAWDALPPNDLRIYKAIRPTRLYRNNALIATKTASSSSMYFKNLQHGAGSAYAQAVFDHSAANPFCSVGSVRYRVTNRFYRSGMVETVGWRRQAPAHEVYARRNDGWGNFWSTITRRTNGGFACLADGACATDYFSASVR